MRIFAFDFETFLIQPGRHVPKAVVFSWAEGVEHGQYGIAHMNPRFRSEVFDGRERAKERLKLALDGYDLVVGANVAYDLAVAGQEWPDLWPLIWKAYRDGRVWDVEVTEKLIAIGNGELKWRFARAADASIVPEKREYNLERLALERLRLTLDKNTWRLIYGTLYDKPLADFPQGAIEYSVMDAVATLTVLWSQLREHPRFLVDSSRQARAAWWLHLMSVRGFALDPHAVEALRVHTTVEMERRKALLVSYGLVRPDGTRDTKAAAARMELVCSAKGIAIKTTEGEGTALDEEACMDSGDPALIAYAEYTSLSGILKKDVATLADAARAGLPIQSRFEVLKETGRTSSSGGKIKKKADLVNRTAFGYQLQNIRRDPPPLEDGSYLPTVRGCFVPRPGYVLCSIDYGQMELHAWAEVCMTLLGHSELARMLNAGIDVHCKLGSMAVHRTYEEVVAARKKEQWAKDARQMSKAGNFGFPGGLGAKAFQAYAKASWGVILTEKEARALYAMWKQMLPEADEYFAFVKRLVEHGVDREIIQVGSDRVRGDVGFTDGANGFFQALAADCAKDAGFSLSEACYLDTSSPLFGSYIVNFVHDEFLFELLIERAHEAAFEAVRLMKEAGRRWMPHCPPGCEPALMKRWYKDAEPRYDDNGRLTVWTPKKPGPMEMRA